MVRLRAWLRWIILNTAVSATNVARGVTPIHALLCADQAAPLDADDLDRLATAAYLTGRDLEFQRILERLHRVHVESGDRPRAARCAFWLAITFLLRGEGGQSNAWTARGQRLVEDRDCVERGYLAVAVAEQQLRDGTRRCGACDRRSGRRDRRVFQRR